MGLPEVTEKGLFAEYFGTSVASEFGVATAEPAIVYLSEDLIQAAATDLARWGIAPKAGEAVGVDYIRGLAPRGAA